MIVQFVDVGASIDQGLQMPQVAFLGSDVRCRVSIVVLPIEVVARAHQLVPRVHVGPGVDAAILAAARVLRPDKKRLQLRERRLVPMLKAGCPSGDVRIPLQEVGVLQSSV